MSTLRRAVVVATVVAGASLPWASAGAGQAAPFTDPYAKGFLALCDQQGHAVTGGSIDAKPFVWKAVSSFVPPAGYSGKGENAALTIYQPRQGVDPGNWNGDQLTGASYYTNSRMPAAQSTYADLSLAAIVREFPPVWDGLYQLRMQFAKTGYGNFTATYPSTIIRVSGRTWSVVQGGSLPCGAARSVSNESYVGIGKTPGPASTSSGAGAAASGGGSPSLLTGGAFPAPPAAVSRHDGSSWLLVAVPVAAAVLSVGGVLWWRRRRQFPLTHPGAAGDIRAAAFGRTSVR